MVRIKMVSEIWEIDMIMAGYFTAKSGRQFTFAAYANDMPRDVSATAAIDAALVAVAEAH